jgi:hypothetical protein
MPPQTRQGLPLQKFTDLASMLVEVHGPAEAAMTCARLSKQFRDAARSTPVAGIVAMHIAIPANRLDAAADLLLEFAVACWAIPDAPPASH